MSPGSRYSTCLATVTSLWFLDTLPYQANLLQHATTTQSNRIRTPSASAKCLNMLQRFQTAAPCRKGKMNSIKLNGICRIADMLVAPSCGSRFDGGSSSSADAPRTRCAASWHLRSDSRRAEPANKHTSTSIIHTYIYGYRSFLLFGHLFIYRLFKEDLLFPPSLGLYSIPGWPKCGATVDYRQAEAPSSQSKAWVCTITLCLGI